VIGAQLVDGRGRLVAGGGKVVKNAAGFDLPKLMVGSMGRLGVIVRLSFKVFPSPRATTTWVFDCAGCGPAIATLNGLARGPLQIDALDLTAESRLLVRLGGDPAILDARAARCAAIVGSAPRRLDAEAERDAWLAATEFGWMPAGSEVVRVASTSAIALVLLDTLRAVDVPVRLSLGANLAWIAWPRERPIADLDRRLTKLGLRGLRLNGEGGRPLLGEARGGAFGARIRRALDPDERFLEL
jgi:glycolate oxidase FAD binding subunit